MESRIFTLGTWEKAFRTGDANREGDLYVSAHGVLEYRNGWKEKGALLDLSPLGKFIQAGKGKETFKWSVACDPGRWGSGIPYEAGDLIYSATIPAGAVIRDVTFDSWGGNERTETKTFASISDPYDLWYIIDGDTWKRWTARYERFIGVFKRVNGIWVDFDLTPPVPEKSPIDREIDKMMERRKAKREVVHREVWEAAERDIEKEKAQGESLDRAISKLSFHSLTIGERLSAYKGPVL